MSTAELHSGGTRPEGDGETLIRLENVSRTYRFGGNDVHALRGVDLDIPAGSFVALKGRSGSGKTTTLNLMGGLDHPTQGRVLYRGRDLADFSDKELTLWRRREVGFVFQAFALLPALTAFENVELPLRIMGVHPRDSAERAAACLELVGLAKRADHRSFELSGGEQQRVGIARALVTNPRLILADEPTGELDQDTGIRILELFRNIIESEGVTVCMATHDPIVSGFADVVHSLEDGSLTGTTTGEASHEGAKDV